MELVKAKFTFSDFEKFPIFEGFYDPSNRYWNGWANPYFNQKTRDSFVLYQKYWMNICEQNSEDDKEFIKSLETIQPEIINGEKLFYFGGFLCWDEVEDEEVA